MVYVNRKKFACESCIKGHRSSSCHHTERPLFEVKRKGRPVSQCEKCRELRQSRKVHSKCTCKQRDDSLSRGQPQSSTQSRRFVPIVPALPHGLKDVFNVSKRSTSVPPNTRQRVDSLLNPCHCKSVSNCKCRSPSSATSTSTCSSSKRLVCRPNIPCDDAFKRHKDVTPAAPPLLRVIDLPPILTTNSSPTSSTTHSIVPNFPLMPPLSTIASLAGSGCTCGFQCACPDCPEHGANQIHNGCGSSCRTCTDPSLAFSLPGSNAGKGVLDQFFTRAASLPLPPASRKVGSGVSLDPVNVLVYPSIAREREDRGVAFGLVQVPKLECCGGKCGCPNGKCGCGHTCDGCCKNHGDELGSTSARQEAMNETHVQLVN